MMKKSGQQTLLMITLLFIAFIFGIMFERQYNQSSVRLSSYDRAAAQTVEETSAIQTDSNGKININTATAEDLALLPGIGVVLAQRIVDYRQEHGPFMNINELTEVNGIGEMRIEAILDYITVGG